MSNPNMVYVAPFRSVAAALLLAIVFGPIGLMYSTVIGGVIMTALALAGIGTVVAMKSLLPMVTVWLLSIFWAMIAVRWYNNRLMKKLGLSLVQENTAKPKSTKAKQNKSAAKSHSEPGKTSPSEQETNIKWQL